MGMFFHTYGRIIIAGTIGLILVLTVISVISSSFGDTVVAEVETMVVNNKVMDNTPVQYRINSFRVDFDDASADNYYMNYQHYYNQVIRSIDKGNTFETISDYSNIRVYLKSGTENTLIDQSLNYVSRMQYRGNYQLKYVITDNGRSYTYMVNIMAD